MLASFALCLLLGHGREGLDRNVTFSHPPARIEILLPKLSKVAGLELRFDATTADEPVVVHVTNASLREVLARLAQVCSAEWVRRGEGQVLTRSSAVAAQQEKADKQALQKDVREELLWLSGPGELRPPLTKASAQQLAKELEIREDDLLKDSAKNGSDDARERAVRRLLPINVAHAQICRALDPAMVAALPPGRWVFASRPTSMQIKLPASLEGIVGRLLAEQKLLAGITGKKPTDSWPDDDFAEALGDDEVAFPPTARVLLVISVDIEGGYLGDPRAWNESAVMVQLVVLDGQKQVLARAGGIIELGDDRRSDALELKPVTADIPAATVPEDLRTFVEWEKAPIPTRDALRAKLLLPEQFDPAAFMAAGLLPAYATAKNVNLVAHAGVPNGLYRWGTPKRMPADYVREYLSSERLVVEEGDGWLVIKPARPASERKQRPSRSAFGKHLRRLLERKALNLEDAVAIYGGDGPGVGGLLNYYCYRIEPHLFYLVRDPLSEATAFYASLTREQRKAFWNPQGLPVAALTPAQRQLATELVYRHSYVRVPREDDEDGRSWEPTESLPWGLAPGARIRVSSAIREAFLTDFGRSYLGITDAGRLAYQLLENEDKGVSTDGFQFMSAPYRRGQVVIDHGHGMATSVHFQFSETVPGSRPVPYLKLSPGDRAAIEAAKVKAKEVRRNHPGNAPKKPPPQ
jgi:hypothetical protein